MTSPLQDPALEPRPRTARRHLDINHAPAWNLGLKPPSRQFPMFYPAPRNPFGKFRGPPRRLAALDPRRAINLDAKQPWRWFNLVDLAPHYQVAELSIVPWPHFTKVPSRQVVRLPWSLGNLASCYQSAMFPICIVAHATWRRRLLGVRSALATWRADHHVGESAWGPALPRLPTRDRRSEGASDPLAGVPTWRQVSHGPPNPNAPRFQGAMPPESPTRQAGIGGLAHGVP